MASFMQSTAIGKRCAFSQTLFRYPAEACMTMKLLCSRCAALIMPTTATRTGGLCMPCFTNRGAKPRHRPGVPHARNKVRFACFSCREAFKQIGSSTWDPGVPDRPFPCPECKQPMCRMGRYFKAPPRRAVRAWRDVQEMYLQGERFN